MDLLELWASGGDVEFLILTIDVEPPSALVVVAFQASLFLGRWSPWRWLGSPCFVKDLICLAIVRQAVNKRVQVV